MTHFISVHSEIQSANKFTVQNSFLQQITQQITLLTTYHIRQVWQWHRWPVSRLHRTRQSRDTARTHVHVWLAGALCSNFPVRIVQAWRQPRSPEFRHGPRTSLPKRPIHSQCPYPRTLNALSQRGGFQRRLARRGTSLVSHLAFSPSNEKASSLFSCGGFGKSRQARNRRGGN